MKIPKARMDAELLGIIKERETDIEKELLELEQEKRLWRQTKIRILEGKN